MTASSAGSAPTAQPVLAPLTRSAIFLVLVVDPGGEATVRDLLADLAGLARGVSFRAPDDGLSAVAGIGSSAWDRLYSGPRPARLHPFVALDGDKHHAPATPGDLLLHLRAERLDLCFELAGTIMNQLTGAARIVDEVHGFRYFDQRDLLGFVDGTENPVGPAAQDAVLIDGSTDGATDDADAAFTAGSYVIVQKYRHDLAAWNAETVEEQERVIGRSKLADTEMDEAVKPANAHIAVNVITDEEGNQLQILRHNMAFGSVGADEYGTYFIGYARSPEITERMLRRMFIGEPRGNYDRVLDFSTAVTGGLFFVPSVDFLEDPPPLPPGAQRPGSTSLGIGSLRRSPTS